ncbi:YkvA family protein [Mangrovibacter phragmitis]|nr:YkvA family protein [Mangrovibacter phragmitis]
MTKGRISKARQWAKSIKRDVHAVWLAARDPRTPWFVKVLALVVAAYAVSPVDLIPDFIPVLGYVDDIIIVPLGIMLVVRLIPPEVMNEHRETAAKATGQPVSRMAAGVFIAIWIVCAILLVRLLH